MPTTGDRPNTSSDMSRHRKEKLAKQRGTCTCTCRLEIFHAIMKYLYMYSVALGGG